MKPLNLMIWIENIIEKESRHLNDFCSAMVISCPNFVLKYKQDYFILMDLKRLIAEEYIQQCRLIGEKGYSRLSSERDNIRSTLINQFGSNGYPLNSVEKLVFLYDHVIFDFLDNAMSRGSRSLGWPSFYEGELMKKIMSAAETFNIDHQQS